MAAEVKEQVIRQERLSRMHEILKSLESLEKLRYDLNKRMRHELYALEYEMRNNWPVEAGEFNPVEIMTRLAMCFAGKALTD